MLLKESLPNENTETQEPIVKPEAETHLDMEAAEYATPSRRMLGALLDIVLVFLLVIPVDYIVETLIFRGRNFVYLINEYQQTHPGADKEIDIIEFINYLHADNFIVKYIVSMLVVLLVIGLYCVCFWAIRGATPGKMISRCVIVNARDGQKITWKQAVLRFFGYIPSTMLLCLGFVLMHFTPRYRALHDYIGGTVVLANPKRDIYGSNKSS